MCSSDLSTVLTPTTAEGWPYSEDECERQRDALLRRLVLRLGQPTTGPGGRYVLKFSSYCAMRLDLIRALWPRVPVVFLVRDPVEVMVSNFSRGSAWQGIWRRPVQASEMFGWVENSAAMSREEFSARVIGRLCHMATLYRGAPSLVMDYRELVSGGWRRILGFLGYPAPDLLEQAAIDEEIGRAHV